MSGLAAFCRVHLVHECMASGGLSWRVPSLLSALSLCAWCVACKYGSISRFKGVFSGFWGCCVGLFVLGALRGLWGFCVREWLGGYMTCCVFASVFPLFASILSVFHLLRLSSGALPLLSSACPLSCLSFLVCSCVLCGFCCCFLFPYGLYAKERAQSVFASSLVPLWVCL